MKEKREKVERKRIGEEEQSSNVNFTKNEINIRMECAFCRR